MGIFSFIGGQYQFIKRYNQILRVLLRYGFEDVVAYLEEQKRFHFLKKLIPRSTYEHAIHLTKWEKIRMVAEELGPTFVKFGQLLSNRTDLLPPELIKELEKLQDSVPPFSGKEAWKLVESQLNKRPKDIFASFDEQAFASASMAQVHKATLKNGNKVVLKIQRPGIQEVIFSDIKVMTYMANVFTKRIPSIRSFDPVGLVRNFEDSITHELDFIHESINIQRFHDNFFKDETDKGYIHSPKVYRELTTEKVLTLEFIDGIKISDHSTLTQNGLDSKKVARRLAYSYLKQVFNYGFFHADPHPGNLLVLPNNVICYLDYGMMGNIIRKDLEQFGYLFLSVNSKDIRKIIRSLQNLSDYHVVRDYRALEADLNEFVHNYSIQDEFQSGELSTILLELKDIIVKHRLKVPSHFFLLARSMVTIEGVIHGLDPDLNLTKMARPFLLRAVARQYNPIRFAKRFLNSLYEMGIYMEEFPRDLKNAIRRINSGEVKVNLRHEGIDPMVHTINRVTKQVVSAVILAAIIVSSSLLLIFEVRPLWGESSLWGVIGFILAGIIMIGMLRDLSWGDHDDWPGWKEND